GVMGLSPEEAIWYLFYIFVALLGIRAHRMHQAGRATPAARATGRVPIWISEVVGDRGPATSSCCRSRCGLL
ncbi:hypothetical protein KI387_010585, partial [Taxus chinensis]